MARLIDADALKKDLVENYGFFPALVMRAIDKQPTIDAEPIVRCRDCAVPHNKWTGCPKLNGLVPPDNFYCAFGVRRDSDGKAD